MGLTLGSAMNQLYDIRTFISSPMHQCRHLESKNVVVLILCDKDEDLMIPGQQALRRGTKSGDKRWSPSFDIIAAVTGTVIVTVLLPAV